MKKTKKALALILAGMMAASMTACGSGKTAETTQAAADTTAAESADGTKAEASADGASYKVGICQLVQHVALDAATEGFKDALTEALGEQVTFDEQNAQGDSNTCSTIINNFVAEDVDLILANATPALQAAQAGTDTIPVLGTAVTEYGVALGIDDFNGTVGGNISGTADLAPLNEQAAMLKELFPDAKNVGLLYCSAEANSQYQVDTVKAELEKLGYTCEYYAFSDSNDLATIVTNAANSSDVIYIPTDNTAAANTENLLSCFLFNSGKQAFLWSTAGSSIRSCPLQIFQECRTSSDPKSSACNWIIMEAIAASSIQTSLANGSAITTTAIAASAKKSCPHLLTMGKFFQHILIIYHKKLPAIATFRRRSHQSSLQQSGNW